MYEDVLVYGEYQELSANRVDARFVSNREKQVIAALEMSCPLVSKRDRKTSDHEVCGTQMGIEADIPGFEINPCNIILDVLGRQSRDLDATLQKLVGSKAIAKGVLKKRQKACLS